MESKKTFGEYIRERRRAMGLTQREFAEKLYVTESAVSKWERGMSYPDVTLLRDICAVLGVTEHELLTASEDTERRSADRLAAKYLRLTRNYRAALYILFGAVLLGCAIGNLAAQGTLSWFWIVLAAVGLAASPTLVPALAIMNPKTEGVKWHLAAASFLVWLELLLLICCLYTGGTWLPVAGTAVLFGALSLLRLDWRIQPFVALSVLYLYVCACGSRPSAMRAFGMIALMWLALAFSRGTGAFGALVVAAAVAVAVSPPIIFDAGFCLSYAIVASIFVYSLPLYSYVMRVTSSGLPAPDTLRFRVAACLKAYFVGGFCISLGAMFASAPLGAYFFSYFAPLSVLYSPLFVSGAGLAVGLGFIGFVLPAFLAGGLNCAAASIVGAMSECASFAAHAFGGRVDFRMPSPTLAYAAVFGFLFLSAFFADSRSVFLRFALAPVFVASIMIVSLLQNG